MYNNTKKSFEFKRINCPLLPFDNIAQDYVSFQHGAFTEQNTKAIYRKIWTEFKRFTRKCMRKIPPYRRFQKIVYGSSHGFPVAIMPDNSEIITINHLDDVFMLHFAWIVDNGGNGE